jgi:hypothetical protein
MRAELIALGDFEFEPKERTIVECHTGAKGADGSASPVLLADFASTVLSGS